METRYGRSHSTLFIGTKPHLYDDFKLLHEKEWLFIAWVVPGRGLQTHDRASD